MKIRPKVRYKVVKRVISGVRFRVYCEDAQVYSAVVECETRTSAKRIAAALNLHEAVRRGEIKVSE